MNEISVVVGQSAVEVNVGGGHPSVSTGTPVVKEFVERDPYTGPVEINPANTEQRLETTGFRMTEDIVIKPIPNNYGLIGWNGSILTVS